VTKILPRRERHEHRVLDPVNPSCVIYTKPHDGIAVVSGSREMEEISTLYCVMLIKVGR